MKLAQGEIICDKCNGTGEITNKSEFEFTYLVFNVCLKCLGSGKLNWVEVIFGKELLIWGQKPLRRTIQE